MPDMWLKHITSMLLQKYKNKNNVIALRCYWHEFHSCGSSLRLITQRKKGNQVGNESVLRAGLCFMQSGCLTGRHVLPIGRAVGYGIDYRIASDRLTDNLMVYLHSYIFIYHPTSVPSAQGSGISPVQCARGPMGLRSCICAPKAVYTRIGHSSIHQLRHTLPFKMNCLWTLIKNSFMAEIPQNESFSGDFLFS